jgi:CBS domain-containing protein
MTTNARTIMGDYSVERALGAIEHDEFSGYPVIDRQGRCLGLTTLARLRRVAAEGGGESSASGCRRGR